MRILNTSVKFAIGVIGICSVVALAESAYDKKFYSASFMDDVQPIELNIVQPEIKTRLVASSIKAPKMPKIQTVGMNLKEIIDGEWEIIKAETTSEGVYFNKENPVANQKEGKATFGVELVEESLVRLDGDDEYVYSISLMTRFGTMKIFKEVEEGEFDVIELVKVKKEKEVEMAQQQVAEKTFEQAVEEKVGNKFDIKGDLYLVNALDPKRSRRVSSFKAANGQPGVTGEASLVSGVLELRDIVLHAGTPQETAPLSFVANLSDVGSFKVDEEIAGVVSVIGNKEIKVVFSVGPLASAALNFVIEEKKIAIEEKMEEAARVAEENRLEKEAQMEEQAAPVQAVNQQRVQPQQNERYEDEQFEDEQMDEEYKEEGEPQELTDEMAAQVKAEGFNFGAAPSREIASQK